MLLRRLEPRSWLLAAFAACGLLCAAIAMSGFGGGYTLLPNNPGMVPALPPVPQAGNNTALGPLEAYAQAYQHPLFYADRRAATAHLAGQGDNNQALDVVLTSVIMTPKLQMAIVQDPKSKLGLRVREGQAIGGAYANWKLTGLSPRSATFDNGSADQTTLDLRIYDGHGGEEPTRMGLTPQAVAAGVLGPPRDAAPDPNAASAADDSGNDAQASAPPDANQNAARAAAEAAQQAEQIRRRIEQRRQQAQAERAGQPDKER